MTTPQTAWSHDEDPLAQEQHMHWWVCAPGIEMMCWRTCQGLFRTWRKTWEAGDPLGESCPVFHFKVSHCWQYMLLTSNIIVVVILKSLHHHTIIYALTNKHQSFPAVASSLPSNQVQPISSISVQHAKQHKTNDMAPSLICYDTTRGAWISLGIVKEVRCRRVWCPTLCGFYIITSIYSLSILFYYVHQW